ncbi:MAG: MFS transporter [Legionellaceae bacterium]|nr:MFS transporter [Legionellaceae bacterium]
MLTQKHKYFPFLMWLFPLAFFAFQFILRLWPGLMMHQIMAQFSINASQFGLIAAFYYYGYAGMQIPVALLLERFGARYIVFAFAMLCGIATILFTYSNSLYLACFSRFLVGAGSAVGFLGISKVLSEWFPAKQYTKMVGFSFSVGLLGAIYGGKPINALIETYHWKNVALTLAMLSMVIACGAYIVMRSAQKQEVPSEGSFQLSYLKTILSSPPICLLALSNLLMVGSLEGFSDVWGVPYLMTAYGISKSTAAELISFVFFGMLFGGPVLAWCSEKSGNYKVIACCGVGMALAFAILLLTQQYHWWSLALLFFSIGVMCCYQVIVFAAGADLVKAQYLGVTIAFLNCINMLGGSLFHTVIGRLMDIFWTGALDSEGIKQYSLAAYHCALAFIPLCAIVGAIIVFGLGYSKIKRNFMEANTCGINSKKMHFSVDNRLEKGRIHISPTLATLIKN